MTEPASFKSFIAPGVSVLWGVVAFMLSIEAGRNGGSLAALIFSVIGMAISFIVAAASLIVGRIVLKADTPVWAEILAYIVTPASLGVWSGLLLATDGEIVLP